ncbi:hypothetical protein C5167_044098 [Papaver somniferum]|uniref:Bet v I/Major latex protein domain-containing protein n=1 Tax=Papaver somniferum TaxID=3469 RepID=A0A4Y7L8I6_PAPSO|nr:S-norcoclaurine synthase 2-like [Papaver somniferum]RZC81526.1 hypothetical protein C5167_044098 [Papaver somniferum]
MKSQIVFSIFLFFSSICIAESLNYTLISEFEVAAPADDVWALISSKDAHKTFQMLLPGMFEKLEILEGDGGVGTVLLVVFPPGTVPLSNEGKYVTIDNRRRVREILQVKGGYLDMGVTYFMETFEIIPKGCNCVFKSMIRYEVPDELAPDVSSIISVEGILIMAKAAAKYVVDNSKKTPKYSY